MKLNNLLPLAAPVILICGIARADVEAARPAAVAGADVPTEQVQPDQVLPPEQEALPEEPQIQPPRSIYDKALDQAMNGWLQDPLRHLEGDMSHCVGELTAFKTDRPVQQRQDKIANRMDAIIKMLEKECKGGGGGGSDPSKPLGRSVIAKGPGGQGEMHDPKAGEKQWASLPAKQREQILQSRTEGFPPGFEALLQSYYQRLAQEQVDEPAGGAAPRADDAPGGAREGARAPATTDAPVTAAAANGGTE